MRLPTVGYWWRVAEPGARPNVPAWRRIALRVGGEIARRARVICKKYQLPYNTGALFAHLGAVQRTILRLALAGGDEPRPKPGRYRGGSL